VRFQQYKHFINLSRMDPRRAHVVFTTVDRTRLQLYVHSLPSDGTGNSRPAVPGKVEAQYGARRMAICVSAIMVDGSCLLKTSDRGLRNKFLKGTLHQMEMDRLVGATCHLFNQSVMHTQLDRDMLVFTTAGKHINSDDIKSNILTFFSLAADFQSSNVAGGSYIRSSSIRSPVKPTVKSSSKPRPDFVRAVLSANDEGIVSFFIQYLIDLLTT